MSSPFCDALELALTHCGSVDLIKIDTEGTEPALVEAIISNNLRPRIARVVYEGSQGVTRWR